MTFIKIINGMGLVALYLTVVTVFAIISGSLLLSVSGWLVTGDWMWFTI